MSIWRLCRAQIETRYIKKCTDRHAQYEQDSKCLRTDLPRVDPDQVLLAGGPDEAPFYMTDGSGLQDGQIILPEDNGIMAQRYGHALAQRLRRAEEFALVYRLRRAFEGEDDAVAGGHTHLR